MIEQFKPKQFDSFDKVPKVEKSRFKEIEEGFVYNEALSKEEAEIKAYEMQEEDEKELSSEQIHEIMNKILDLKIKGIATVHNTPLAGFENLFEEQKDFLRRHFNNPKFVKNGKLTDDALFLRGKYGWLLGASGDIDDPDWSTYTKYRKCLANYDKSENKKRIDTSRAYFLGIRLDDFLKTQKYILENEKNIELKDIETIKSHPFKMGSPSSHASDVSLSEINLSEEDKKTLRVIKKYTAQRTLEELFKLQQFILNNNNFSAIRYNRVYEHDKNNTERAADGTKKIFNRKILSDPELAYIKKHPLRVGEKPDYNTMRILKLAEKIQNIDYDAPHGVVGVLSQKFLDNWSMRHYEHTTVGVFPDAINGIILYKRSKIFKDALIKIMLKYQESIGEKDGTNYLSPIYGIGGDLLWPKRMSYEEVKQFIKEREKEKKGEKNKK